MRSPRRTGTGQAAVTMGQLLSPKQQETEHFIQNDTELSCTNVLNVTNK